MKPTPINWRLEKQPIDELIEYQKNPRSMSKKQYKDLQNSLNEFGLIDKPIINLDKQIIGGHQRIRVLRNQKVKEVECWVPDTQLSEYQIAKLCLRLNKNTGSWEYDVLANEWDGQMLLETGFEAKDFEDVLPETKDKKPKVTLVFESRDDLEQVIAVIEQFENCKVKVKL